jgi:hypothetical protein
MHTYLCTYVQHCVQRQLFCRSPGDSVVGGVVSLLGGVGYVVLMLVGYGACRRGLAVAVFTVGACLDVCLLGCAGWCVCGCGVYRYHTLFSLATSTLGMGWHVDAEPLLVLVGFSSAPRALARVPAYYLA